MKYTTMVNGYTAVAMTKMDEVKIGVSYLKNGVKMVRKGLLFDTKEE